MHGSEAKGSWDPSDAMEIPSTPALAAIDGGHQAQVSHSPYFRHLGILTTGTETCVFSGQPWGSLLGQMIQTDHFSKTSG